jgi:short-subunit dehydrogenase involved in D-alanine esterification of teichoic acids
VASSSLFFEVFRKYDAGNRLLTQAEGEVLAQELELTRLEATLQRLGSLPRHSVALTAPSPFALPLMIERGYGRIVNLSSGLGQLDEMGSGTPAYRISKTALNALTRIVASDTRGTGVLVNSVCPGWVRTEMGGAEAPRTVAQGADTVVWLATLPGEGPSGGFFRDRKPIPW